jgi:hypothetical protein
MLLSFKIKNFKSIKDEVELSFEATADKSLENSHIVQIGNYRVLKLCAIYGPNASGKTNILIALNYLRNLIVNSATRLAPNANTGTDPFIFDPETKNGSSEFEITFLIHEIKYAYKLKLSNITIQNEELKYYPKNQPVIIYTREAFEIDDRIIFQTGQGTPLHNSLFNSKNELKTRKNIPYISSILQIEDVPILKDVYDWFDKYLYGLIRPQQQELYAFTSQLLEQQPEYKKYILSILSSSSFGNITEIIQEKIPLEEEILKLLPEEIRNDAMDDNGKIFANRLLFKHTYGKHSANLPFNNESRGTKRYFELSGPLALLIKKNCMFPIDEFDTSIHPELQSFFLEEFFRYSLNSQLLITTHNTQLMDLGIIRRDEIWFTDKNTKDGSTICYSLSDIKGVRKEGSYRKQYNAGKFGAKPETNIIKDF